MDSRYDAICGITEDELYSVFGEVISEMANKFDYTVDEMKSLLKSSMTAIISVKHYLIYIIRLASLTLLIN